MSIFYCVCDSKFSFHPLTFSNWLFYFKKNSVFEWQMSAGKPKYLPRSLLPLMPNLACIFSQMSLYMFLLENIKVLSLFIFWSNASSQSYRISCIFYLVQDDMEKENVIINKDTCFLLNILLATRYVIPCCICQNGCRRESIEQEHQEYEGYMVQSCRPTSTQESLKGYIFII